MTTLGRKALLCLVLPATLGLAGCMDVASLHPLFAAGEAEPVAGIEGFWAAVDNDGDGGLEIKADDAGAYEVVSWDKDGPESDYGRLEARFGHLGGELFWDLSRTDVTPGSNFVWPVHLPARVRLEGRTLEIAFLDPEALGESLQSGEIVLAHTVVDDDLILVEPTDELQAFLRDNAWRDELFTEPLRFVKGRRPR